jgi:hypothetical protein
MGKLNIKISKPGSAVMPNTGGHTDGIKKGGHAHGSKLANPGRSVGTGNPQGRMPLQSPPANITGSKAPKVPNTSAAATKQKRNPFYGD